MTAQCETCAPETSSVTFTCCGKLPNDHFSESGQVWSPLPYARHAPTETYGTIGYLGCGLTSLATLINYYSNNVSNTIPVTNPKLLNEYLLNNNGYNDGNDVKFDTIDNYSNGRAFFIGRYDLDDPYNKEGLLGMADGIIRSGIPMAFWVKRRTLKSDGTFRFTPHFITVIGKCGNNFIIADPAGGIERLYNPDEPDLLFRGLRIFGT